MRGETTMRRALSMAICLLACGGGTPRHANEHTLSALAARAGEGRACMRARLSADSPYHLSLAEPTEDPALLAYLKDVPAEVRRLLPATGLESLLAETLREQSRLHAEHGGALTLELLAQRQAMASLLNSFDSQLASVLFEIDCTDDALEELLDELDRQDRSRELRLTMASIVVSALSAVVAGAWDARADDGRGPAITAAVGAGAGAALGIAAFVPFRRRVRFMHSRNLFTPIVRGEDPEHLFPTFVFRLLTLPTTDGSPTAAEELNAAWRELIRAAAIDDAEALLFGGGGIYSSELLELRRVMFDQLESRVGALQRDLELLERFLARVTAHGNTASNATGAASR